MLRHGESTDRAGRQLPGRTQNAITAYWLSSLMGIVLNWIVITSPEDGESLVLQTYIYEIFYARWLSPENASLAYAISFVLLWLALLSVLYRRRIFIRI